MVTLYSSFHTAIDNYQSVNVLGPEGPINHVRWVKGQSGYRHGHESGAGGEPERTGV